MQAGLFLISDYFSSPLTILRNFGYIGPATSRKLTVFGALRLLFPSISQLLAKRNPAFGFRIRRKTKMPIGTVKFFNDAKGYGFIQPEDGGTDAFVHITAVERAGMNSLRQDQRVSYELEQDRRGKMSAVNLKPEDQAAPQA
jgi:CspA family cold shock protein